MNRSTEDFESPPQDPREIFRWTRAYAQNRSLGVAVSMVVFILLFAAIGGPSYLAGEAYRSNNMPLFWGAIVALVVALVALVLLCLPRWGGKMQERLVTRLYAKEGKVSFAPPSGRNKAWGIGLVVCYAICILASVAIGFAYGIPQEYMQPISALYVVPFLVGLWLVMRPMVGYAALLWPLLYTIHAILIVVGAPIVFTSPWEGLNMLVPIAGYGILAALVGHLYSRYALGKLKRLAATDLPAEARRS